MIMENYKKKAINLISNLLLEYKSDPTVVAHYPAKTEIMKRDKYTLPHGTPEAHGIDSGALTDLLRSLENEPSVNLHSIVIAKDGVVVAEASAPGYDTLLPHLSHSMSKSVTGILIESLIDSGDLSLSSKVTDFFEEVTERNSEINSLTVEHLLTMSSGVAFAEVGSVSDDDWTRAFFESELIFSPGEEFLYNSMNSYILMCIADKIARKRGMNATELLGERIFRPLGITNWFWEKSPQGVPKGGWGLFLSCQSWARIGIMMMQGGIYRGQRILSEEAVKRATSVSISVPRDVSEHDYGHQMWVCNSGGFLFNGMLGQNVWVYPEMRVVVAATSGSCELMQGSPIISLLKKALSDPGHRGSYRHSRDLDRKCKHFFSSREWITLHAPLRGLPYLLGLRSPTPFDDNLIPLLGKYVFPTNNLCLLPSFVSIMQNNYGGGIHSVEFIRHGDVLCMRAELECAEIEIALGSYSYVESTLTQRGETYLVRGAISADTDGDGGFVYKIQLLFPELPNTRRISLSLTPDGRLTLHLSEVPGEQMAPNLLRVAQMSSPRLSTFFSMTERTLGHGYLARKLGDLFTPEITAISSASPGAEDFLAEENEKMTSRINSSRLVRSIVSRFSAEEVENEPQSNGFCAKMSNLLSKFRHS